MEYWKDIEGYEGNYQVSSTGKIRSVQRIVKRGNNFKPVCERLLRYRVNKGYAYVVLSLRGKTRTVWIHKVVASTFIPNPNNFPCVNHKDENKLNNCVENLEWCTWSYNNSYNDLRIRASISKRKPIIQYTKDNEFIREWSYAKEASDSLGINKRAIYACCNGSIKSSGGYIWKWK